LRAIEAPVVTGQRWTESDCRRIEGDLMLARGDAAAAEACWRRAIDIARAQGAASWELRAATRLARLLVDRSSRDEAASLLAAALAPIDGGRDTPDVVAAAALLRELGAADSAVGVDMPSGLKPLETPP
jgi:predicted negative regulator of RcsB-dependent stress response